MDLNPDNDIIRNIYLASQFTFTVIDHIGVFLFNDDWDSKF